MSSSKYHFGDLEGFEVGSQFDDRAQLSKARIHGPPVGGIWGKSSEGSCSIVLSGGYPDDIDNLDEIIYTGDTGQHPTKKGVQIKNQTLSPGNSGMIKSYKKKLPVRVSRGHQIPLGPTEGYRYDGIYSIQDYKYITGIHGFKVYRFYLKSIFSYQELKRKIIHTMDSPVDWPVKKKRQKITFTSSNKFEKSMPIKQIVSKPIELSIKQKKFVQEIINGTSNSYVEAYIKSYNVTLTRDGKAPKWVSVEASRQRSKLHIRRAIEEGVSASKLANYSGINNSHTNTNLYVQSIKEGIEKIENQRKNIDSKSIKKITYLNKGLHLILKSIQNLSSNLPATKQTSKKINKQYDVEKGLKLFKQPKSPYFYGKIRISGKYKTKSFAPIKDFEEAKIELLEWRDALVSGEVIPQNSKKETLSRIKRKIENFNASDDIFAKRILSYKIDGLNSSTISKKLDIPISKVERLCAFMTLQGVSIPNYQSKTLNNASSNEEEMIDLIESYLDGGLKVAQISQLLDISAAKIDTLVYKYLIKDA